MEILVLLGQFFAGLGQFLMGLGLLLIGSAAIWFVSVHVENK